MTSTIRAGTRTHATLLAVCRPKHTVIRLHGEIDLGTAPAVRRRLRNALQRNVDLLVIDMSGVSFCDASGLAVLIGVQQRARRSGVTLRLASPRPRMAELLRITGTDRTFAVHPTLSSALAAGDRGPVVKQSPIGTGQRVRWFGSPLPASRRKAHGA